MELRKIRLKFALLVTIIAFFLFALSMPISYGIADKLNQFNKDIKPLNYPLEVKDTLDPNFTQAEISLLKNLSERRKALEIQAKKLEDKEKILSMLEKNIDKKIQNLEALRKKVIKETKEINAKEIEQIRSFIKIYENMPPKNVAVIFNEMDLDLLVKIIGAMKEIKASSVLASMDVKKAREVSIKLTKKAFNLSNVK